MSEELGKTMSIAGVSFTHSFRTAVFISSNIEPCIVLFRLKQFKTCYFFRKMRWKYKEENTFKKRKEVSAQKRKDQPLWIPVVIQRTDPDGFQAGAMAFKPILTEATSNYRKFIDYVRDKFKLPDTETLYFFVNGIIPHLQDSMISLYEQHKDDDGFLYVAVANENVPGLSFANSDFVPKFNI